MVEGLERERKKTEIQRKYRRVVEWRIAGASHPWEGESKGKKRLGR